APTGDSHVEVAVTVEVAYRYLVRVAAGCQVHSRCEGAVTCSQQHADVFIVGAVLVGADDVEDTVAVHVGDGGLLGSSACHVLDRWSEQPVARAQQYGDRAGARSRDHQVGVSVSIEVGDGYPVSQ